MGNHLSYDAGAGTLDILGGQQRNLSEPGAMNGGAMRTTPDERDTSARPVPPGRRVLAGLADLSPAYFGMVMATGIVSLAAHLLACLS